MNVEHFGGEVDVTDAAALDDILGLRFCDGVNEYWLCGEGRYPLLAILVRGAVACLHFFPAEGHPGFVSVGDGAPGGKRVFYTNTPTEEIEVDSSAVVPFDQARQAAHAFFRSRVIPGSVHWDEL